MAKKKATKRSRPKKKAAKRRRKRSISPQTNPPFEQHASVVVESMDGADEPPVVKD
jgi:hypothetical protein